MVRKDMIGLAVEGFLAVLKAVNNIANDGFSAQCVWPYNAHLCTRVT